jgi:uncharacterized protein (TIGR02391 family)
MNIKLSQFIPDPGALVAFESDELGLRLLPYFVKWPSHERIRFETLLIYVNGHPRATHRSGWESVYPAQHSREIEIALREAWAWLVGAALLIPNPDDPSSKILSRRATRLARTSDPHRRYGASRLPKETLHPSIREDVWGLYHRGKYETAVFEAMKAVEVAVRSASRLDSLIGVALMRRAFDKQTGPLTDMNMEEGERDARAHLFAGAIGSYKNPHSHRNVLLDDPDEAAEIIFLANHLLRIVESSVVPARPIALP